jgi:hypothetical protein
VWLGTCDLTDYDGRFVTLAANKDIVDSLINTYQKCIDLLNPYPACKLTFFEIPPYSIIDFNKVENIQTLSHLRRTKKGYLQI